MNGLLSKNVFLLLAKATSFSVRFFISEMRGNRRRDSYDFTQLLEKCRAINSLREVHAQIITGGYGHNPFLGAKLMNMYIELPNSSMEDARKVFDHLPERDVFTWNVIIQGYATCGPLDEVLNCVSEMWAAGVTANEYTYTFVMKACGALEDVTSGQVIHGQAVKCGLESNLFVGNSLVAFYGKCQEIQSSRKAFQEIPQKDIVSWNSMISSYVDNALSNEALVLLHAMLRDSITCAPDKATLVSIIPACAQASAIREGLWVHSYIIKSNMTLDAALGSGLISMYANCGRIDAARKIFDQISTKNIVVWNAMIKSYGTHGHANEALKTFTELQWTGMQPDGLIFLCVLSACSHAGLVAEGRQLFKQMEEYGVEKSGEHYACMVDLFSRAALIEEAIEFVKTMPIQAGKDAYGAILGACRIHGNMELAEKVAEKLFVLDSENAGRYMILAKMYEDAGRCEDAARVRKLLREKKIRKPVGYSAIEVDYVLHRFGVEDESHPFKDLIFDTLKKLQMVMEDEWAAVDQLVAAS